MAQSKDIVAILSLRLPIADRPAGYLTVREIAEQLDLASEHTVRERLLKLNKEGVLESTRVKMFAIDGSQRLVPAYRVKDGVACV